MAQRAIVVEISRGNRAAKIADQTVARDWPAGGRETFISEVSH